MVTYPYERIASRRSVVYDTFLSVDFSKAPSNVKHYNSPDSLNMIRDEYGKVRRRMGYYKALDYSGKVWGMTKYGDDFIVHVDTKLYKTVLSGTTQTDTVIYSAMNEATTLFWNYESKLYIMDGASYLEYDGNTCQKVAGKVPMVIIGGTPAGGGTQNEQVNLLSDKWSQSYSGDGTSTDYKLAFDDLDNTEVVVKSAVLSGGVVIWNTLVEGTDFSVDRVNGIVSFDAPPSLPVVAGEDNIIITASKDRSDGRNKIAQCTIMKGFGINGYENQIFVSGNPSYPNQMWWSAVADPTYFGDLQYAVLGQDSSAIVSFNAMNTQLIAHKDTNSRKSYLLSVFIETINGLLVPQVKVDKVINGSGCICKYASVEFGEPLFVSNLGVQAITYRDITGYEFETQRGDRINRKLLAESNLEKAIACVYKYFYMIAVNGNVYVLDRLNPMEEANMLSNSYQYNAFFWDDIPATCFFTDGDTLLFGTDNGVMAFYTDDTLSSSYNDNGTTYSWKWEFPEFVGELFYTNKAIKYVALRAKAYVRTTVTIDVQIEGLWYEVLTDNVSFGYLDLNDINLDNLNLSTDTTPKKTWMKYHQRNLDKLAFRVRGNALNEPFGLYSFAFEVKERGKNRT